MNPLRLTLYALTQRWEGRPALNAAVDGTFVCPEGAATLSATIHLLKEGWIKGDEKVVLLNTGTGLKYPETVHIGVPSLNPGEGPER